MTETGLLIAQGAVLLVLFGFLVAVVRASGRQLTRAVPPPLPMDDPVDRDTAAHPVLSPALPDHEPEPELWPPDPVPAAPAHHLDDPFPPLARPPAPEPEDHPEEAPRFGPDDDPLGDTDAPLFTHDDPDATFLNLDSSNLAPRLVVERGHGLVVGTVFPLGQGLTIGRSRSNELHVDDSFVSHMHARILRRGAFYYVEDLGSTNGTFLNDNRVDSGTPLRVRDTLRMGETVLRYEE